MVKNVYSVLTVEIFFPLAEKKGYPAKRLVPGPGERGGSFYIRAREIGRNILTDVVGFAE